ncbi:MAG: hypothetical protein HYV34_04480 [Candidatus Kerfeldbacteria bacterium]|nr:hypothetical protein [Candidatus Kerfeldbacteria bacterium]
MKTPIKKIRTSINKKSVKERKPQHTKPFRRGIRHAFVAGVLLIALSASFFVSTATPARALFGIGDISITVGDVPRQIFTTIKNHLDSAFSIAWRRALHSYLSQLAFRSATFVASGGQGQGPLFTSEGLGQELKDAGNAAAGDALASVFSEGRKYCEGGNFEGKACTTSADCNPPAPSGCAGVEDLDCDALCEDETDFDSCVLDCLEAQGSCADVPAIETEGRCTGGLSIDLCNINPKVGVKIHASIYRTAANIPPQPRCKWTDIQNQFTGEGGILDRATTKEGRLSFVQTTGFATNLSEAIRDGTFEELFNPESNDLGQYFSVLVATEEEQAKAEAKVEEERSKDTKDVKSTITGKVKTPGWLVKTQLEGAVQKADISETTEPKSILYAAINTFTSTLQAKLFENIVKGFNPEADVPGSAGRGGSFSSLLGGYGASPGRAAAEAKFASLAKPTFGGGGALDVLSQFTVCPSGDHGPTDCVLEANSAWAQAIQDEMRVQQAADLRPDILDQYIGYGPNGEDLALTEGLPMRSLKVLRRYRVIPVSWELAAEYAKKVESKGYRLRDYLDAFDAVNESGEPLSPYYQMIDPQWVLKIPQTECRRTGYGEVLDFDDFQDDDGNAETPTPRLIQRRADICVDDQSCLFQNDDGTCQGVYGYCTKEEEIWRFEGQKCEEHFASCRTFTKTGGGAVSYLERTVDKEGCTAGNAGCQWYCKEADADGRFTCYDDGAGGYSNYTPDDPLGTDKLAYLNGGLQSCPESSVGCRAFIPLLGSSNLVSNGNFTFTNDAGDAFVGWNTANVDEVVLDGEKDPTVADLISDFPRAIQLNQQATPGTLEYELDLTYPGGGYDLANRVFALSFNGRATEDGVTACPGYAQIVDKATGQGAQVGVEYSSAYQRFSLNHFFDETVTDDTLVVRIFASSQCSIAIDEVQLEEIAPLDAVDAETAEVNLDTLTSTTFADYATRNITRLNGKRLSCEEQDVGCELYTPTSEPGLALPGVAKPSDVCREDQVGCKVYEEKAYPATFGIPDLTFADRQARFTNVIPDNAEQCSAQYVGCEEYTNLREQQEGGEALEYYTFVKQCVVPDQLGPGVATRTYYTLETGDYPGYQARSYELLKSDLSDAPCTNVNLLNVPYDARDLRCDDTNSPKLECTLSEDGPDCLEYYYVDPDDGTIETFNRMRSLTVTASETCSPLRNTLDQKTYYGDPQLSTSCPATANTCREYVGNYGYNTRQVLFDRFEDGNTSGWSAFIYSNESLEPDGHSIKTHEGNTRTAKTVEITPGRSYMLSFWARGFGNISVHFEEADEPDDFFARPGGGAGGGEVNLDAAGDEWQFYRLGPVQYTGAGSQELIFEGFTDPGAGDDASYLDNIQLTEVADSVFLTRNSVEGDAQCTQVGCTAYTSELGKSVNLASFSRLCKEEVVGCEAAIDTQNTVLNPYAETFGQDASQIRMNQDLDPQNQDATQKTTVQFVVADTDVLCQASEQGCALLGRPVIDVEKDQDGEFQDVLTEYQSLYARDDPDMYSVDGSGIWCGVEDLQCAEYSDGVRKVYFKDPGSRVCEYRRLENSLTFDWYVAGSDEKCTIDPLSGTPGQPVPYGEGGFVGACPVEKNGCTEYRDPKDPISSCRANCPLRLNENGLPIEVRENCEPVDVDQGESGLPGCKPYYYLNSTIESADEDIVDDDQGLKLFYNTNDPLNASSYASNISPDGAGTGDANATGYCENDHSIACSTADDCLSFGGGACKQVEEVGTPVLCQNGQSDGNQAACDSNQIVNVRPDRECAEWLSCKTSVFTDDPEDYDNDGSKVEETCLELQKCSTLDPATGRCTDPIAQTDTPDGDAPENMDATLLSGYVNAGYLFDEGGADYSIDGKYHFQNMTQRGLATALNTEELVPKWNFEPIAAITGDPFLKCTSGIRKGKNCMEDAHCPDAEGNVLADVCVNNLGEWTAIESNDTIAVEEESRNTLTDGNNILRATSNGSAENGAHVDLGDVIFTGQEYAVSLKSFLDRFSGPVPTVEVSLAFSSGEREHIGFFTPSTEKLTEYVLPPHTVVSQNTKGGLLVFDVVQHNDNGDLVTGNETVVWFDDVSLKPVLEVSTPLLTANDEGVRADYYALEWKNVGNPGLDGLYNGEKFVDPVYVPLGETKTRTDPKINFYESPANAGLSPNTPKPLTLNPIQPCGTDPAYPCGGADPFTNTNERALGAVWQGGFYVSEGGKFTFLINTNDGFSFYLDDTSVALFDGVGGIPTRGFSATKYFDRGWHPVKVEWDNTGGSDGGIQLGVVKGETDYHTVICIPEGNTCPMSHTVVGDTDIYSANGTMSPPGPLGRWHGIPNEYIVTSHDLTTALEAGFGELLATELEPSINYTDFDSRLLTITGQENEVAVRWTGQLNITEEAGAYSFRTAANDGVRFVFDGKTLEPQGWTDGSKTLTWSVDPSGVGWKDFTLDYYENLGTDAQMEFEWQPPSAGAFSDPGADHAFRPPANAESGFVARSCRAYPKSDAQQCDVIEDNAVKYNGWEGYCIERDPTNLAQCLTWYPIDVLRGESIQQAGEQVGYSDRVPLYYCLRSSGNYSPASYVTRIYSQMYYAGYQVDYDNLTESEKRIYFCGSATDTSGACNARIANPNAIGFGTRRFPIVTGVYPDPFNFLTIGNPERFNGISAPAGGLPSTIQGKNGADNDYVFDKAAFEDTGCEALVPGYLLGAPLTDCGGGLGGLNQHSQTYSDYTFGVCNEADHPNAGGDHVISWGSVNIYPWDSDAGDPEQDMVYPLSQDGGYLSEDDIEGFVITPAAAYGDCRIWPSVTLTRDTFGKSVGHPNHIGTAISYSYAREVVRNTPWGDGDDGTVDEIYWSVRPSSSVVAINEDSPLSWENSHVKDSTENFNGLWFRAVFNENRKLIRYDFRGDDETGDRGQDEMGLFTVKVLLRESCKEVVKVADVSGATSWANRVTKGSDYLVEGDLYDPEFPGDYNSVAYSYGEEDTKPFGAAVTEEGAPESWDSKPEEAFQQPLYIENKETSSDQVRAGSPYGCYGYCNISTCANNHSKTCITSADCTVDGVPSACIGKTGVCEEDRSVACSWGKFSVTTCQDAGAGDRCVSSSYDASSLGSYKNAGTNYKDSGWSRVESVAVRRLQDLFAAHLGIWQWDYKESKYVRRTSNDLWTSYYQNMGLCNGGTGVGTRPEQVAVTDNPAPTPPDKIISIAQPPADYCGLLPAVADIEVNGNDGLNIGDLPDLGFGGGEVELTFTTSVDVEQQPLKTIVIDWGDGNVFTVPWDQKTKSDSANPHTFRHTYIASEDTDGCGVDAGHEDGECQWKPEIMVVDNWEFCNNQSASAPGSGGRALKCRLPNDTYTFDQFGDTNPDIAVTATY